MPDFDPQTDRAIDIVARHLVHGALEHALDNAWEQYPEIGQGHFDEVERRAMTMVGECPDSRSFSAAYDHLDQLAKKWAQDHPDAG